MNLCPRCKQESSIESSHTKDGKLYCLVCSAIVASEEGTTLGQQKDIDSVSMSTREEIELGRELFEGAGQLKGQKIERAQIVCHLKGLASHLKGILPNSPDASVISDIAFLIERREHWSAHGPGEREDDGE